MALGIGEWLWGVSCLPCRKAGHCPPRSQVQEHPGEKELHLCHCWPGLGRAPRVCDRHHWHRSQSKSGHQEVHTCTVFLWLSPLFYVYIIATTQAHAMHSCLHLSWLGIAYNLTIDAYHKWYYYVSHFATVNNILSEDFKFSNQFEKCSW